MDETVWVGLIDVRPGPDGMGGAYAYCAGRGASLAEAVAAISAAANEREFEIEAIEWLTRYTELDESRRASEAVAAVLVALADGDAGLDHFFSYPEDGEPDPAGDLKGRVEELVGEWIEGALENCGAFAFGDFAFVAEMQFPDGEPPELGWAYHGLLEDAPALFARAAEAAEDE